MNSIQIRRDGEFRSIVGNTARSEVVVAFGLQRQVMLREGVANGEREMRRRQAQEPAYWLGRCLGSRLKAFHSLQGTLKRTGDSRMIELKRMFRHVCGLPYYGWQGREMLELSSVSETLSAPDSGLLEHENKQELQGSQTCSFPSLSTSWDSRRQNCELGNPGFTPDAH
jgi:hypothetical protein